MANFVVQTKFTISLVIVWLYYRFKLRCSNRYGILLFHLNMFFVKRKQVSTNASTLLNLIYVLVFTNLKITFIFL